MMILMALVGLITPLFLMVSAECGGDVRWRDRDALSVIINTCVTWIMCIVRPPNLLCMYYYNKSPLDHWHYADTGFSRWCRRYFDFV